MISVNEAIAIVLTHAGQLPPQKAALSANALRCALAQEIYANTDIPPFDQSAMDGYAFRFSDWDKKKPLTIAGEIPAGDAITHDLPPNTAIRIYTGAPVPNGADTVVMQEKVTLLDDGQQLIFSDDLLTKGANIRPRGSQIQQGSVALQNGQLLTAGAIGYLAMLGIAEVWITPRPKITLLITGNELTPPGFPLKHGQVYECNSFSLTAALQEIHLQPQAIYKAEDDEQQIATLIQEAAHQSDIIILTGGVSVGNYDFVPRALAACGAQTLFHKVKQKPGKPLYFGKINNTLVFGLPGNPAAVLTGFYRYILPAIKKMMGLPLPSDPLTYRLASDYPKKPGLTFLLKGKILSKDEVLPLPNQLSYLMDSFAQADCLIELEEAKADYQKGDTVKIHLFH